MRLILSLLLLLYPVFAEDSNPAPSDSVKACIKDILESNDELKKAYGEYTVIKANIALHKMALAYVIELDN